VRRRVQACDRLEASARLQELADASCCRLYVGISGQMQLGELALGELHFYPALRYHRTRDAEQDIDRDLRGARRTKVCKHEQVEEDILTIKGNERDLVADAPRGLAGGMNDYQEARIIGFMEGQPDDQQHSVVWKKLREPGSPCRS
jgi:hypothetical protein